MKATCRSCDANYKSEAVRLAIDRNNVMSIGRDMGVVSTTPKRWESSGH